jgi:hypothetical protein
MQQHLLLTLLARYFALGFASRRIASVASESAEAIEITSNSGDSAAPTEVKPAATAEMQRFLRQMPALHATSSGLKALATTLSCEGAQ